MNDQLTLVKLIAYFWLSLNRSSMNDTGGYGAMGGGTLVLESLYMKVRRVDSSGSWA